MTPRKERTMIRSLSSLFSLGAVVALVAACSPEAPFPTASTRRAAQTLQVGAVQYTAGQASQVSASCSGTDEPDVCAVQELVAQAADQGAVLVVAPELGLGQTYYDPDPDLGEVPADDPQWEDGSFIKMFSQQAQELGIYIVIHLATVRGTTKRSTQVALGPDGAVVGRHYKFELFASEQDTYTPGDDVMVFSTPLGKVGLLICADIYGDLALHQRLVEELGAQVVAFSSYWTAAGAANWQASFAKNWGVYVVGSNTASGKGVGGGVFGPDGAALIRVEEPAPSVITAELPTP